jgi:hypothetical protein
MTEVVKHLTCKHESLSSNPNNAEEDIVKVEFLLTVHGENLFPGFFSPSKGNLYFLV